MCLKPHTKTLEASEMFRAWRRWSEKAGAGGSMESGGRRLTHPKLPFQPSSSNLCRNVPGRLSSRVVLCWFNDCSWQLVPTHFPTALEWMRFRISLIRERSKAALSPGEDLLQDPPFLSYFPMRAHGVLHTAAPHVRLRCRRGTCHNRLLWHGTVRPVVLMLGAFDSHLPS